MTGHEDVLQAAMPLRVQNANDEGVKHLKGIKVPRAVEEKLSEGEWVIGKATSRRTDYYATDQRLLRFTGPSRYRELDYAQLSITFTKGGVRATVAIRAEGVPPVTTFFRGS